MDPVEFHLFGLSRRQRPWRPLPGGSRILAIAPFVNRTALDALIGAGKEACRLVSRQEELDKLPDDTLGAWEQIFVLSDAAQEEPEDGAGAGPTGLHAKVIAVEHGWDVTWFVGSANLTAAAFTGNNVEMMASVTDAGDAEPAIAATVSIAFSNPGSKVCVRHTARTIESPRAMTWFKHTSGSRNLVPL